MTETGPILVPLDGSQLAERSLHYATALARALQRKLVLMVAAYISDIPEHGPWSEEMVSHPRETCMTYLADVRDRIKVLDAELVVKVGYPHEMILDTASELDASFVVISTHGRSGFSRWTYGGVAGHLVHRSHVPILVIGKEVTGSAAEEFSPRHVMVPLDGTTLGETALPHALELAAAFGAKVTLLRVAPFSVEAYPMMVQSMYWPPLDEEFVAGATAYLEKVRSSIDQHVEAEVLQGPRAETLIKFVEAHAVDLIVMTTHGRAGLQRAVLGSTADRLLQSTAPVLLIRPDSRSEIAD